MRHLVESGSQGSRADGRLPKLRTGSALLPLDADRVVEVSRRGIRIDRDGTQQPEPLPSTCFERIALVRHTRIEPPVAAATEVVPRHFIELYSWVPLPVAAGDRQRALQWKLAEVIGSKIEWREMKEITREPGSTWMLQEVPRGQTDVYFEMLATGESRWRFGQSGVEGVVEALPEFRPSLQDNLPAAPTTGQARVDVTVMDRFDTPLEGATVKLTGVVDRESNSDAAGAVRFESLPEGRYDVVASAKGLSSSVTRVLDLSSSRGTIVALRLKPSAPTATVGAGLRRHRFAHHEGTSSGREPRAPCQGDRSEDLGSRAISGGPRAGPDDREPGPGPAAVQEQRPAHLPGSTIHIEQEGGSLDRGDYIDHHQFNRLGPLNIGDG